MGVIGAVLLGVASLAAHAYRPGSAWSAAETGNLDALQQIVAAQPELLDRGSQPADLGDAEGDTLLIVAVRNGRGEVVRWLLAEGADPNRAGNAGATPLHHAVNEAAWYGQRPPTPATSLTLDLLAHGADPSLTDNQGRSALHYALLNLRPAAVVQALLSAGADPNLAFDFEGTAATTPLHLVAHLGARHLEQAAWALQIADALREAGADPGLTDAADETAESLLAQVRLPEVVVAPVEDPPHGPPAPGKLITRVRLPQGVKAVALTFDDGPQPRTTAAVLDLLAAHGAKATFFLIGRNVAEWPALARRVADAGHALGNHTQNHLYSFDDPAKMEAEVTQAEEAIFEATGQRPTLFRPPGGVLDNGLVDYAKSRGWTVALWSFDSLDWKADITADQLVEQVQREVRPGAILILHDGGGRRGEMLAALPRILAYLKKEGYDLVTLPRLMELARGN